MFLSVVIPAYNEEKRIGKTLLEVGDYLSRRSFDSEIIVVNDGSKDDTVKVVEGLKAGQFDWAKNLKLINNNKNCGKGCVVRQGLLQAIGEFRLFMDADNSTSIKEIEKMIPYLQQDFDIIIGSRDIEGAFIKTPQTNFRKKLGKIYKNFVNALFSLSVSDTQCGFKIFSKKAAESVLPKCKINGWSFDVEILALATKLGFKIKEVPVVWENSQASKMTFKGMVKSIIDLLKLKLNLVFNRYGI